MQSSSLKLVNIILWDKYSQMCLIVCLGALLKKKKKNQKSLKQCFGIKMSFLVEELQNGSIKVTKSRFDYLTFPDLSIYL